MSKQFEGKLKGSSQSTCTKRVLTVALEHDVSIPVEEINWAEQEHKKHPYLDLQVCSLAFTLLVGSATNILIAFWTNPSLGSQ